MNEEQQHIKLRKKFKQFVKELSRVLKKHNASLMYTTSDDGIHVAFGEGFNNKIFSIGFVDKGTSPQIENILANEKVKQ